ncbi:hypothetical protein CU097_014162 [Rhizopus azygosporus]|uniref:Xylanolytic transcriptional activator regulatory domain-containing protein n=1 Tax=Rhizopus azygosporus TaxID=86630 RepID=A0A367KEW3_RHIAZ|nr:hypothetical protein CU097_014162 [Rhizopus azygosporus]
MSKRKISCSSCRSKKLKCDGGNPCERFGRPPKNAVVNKFILARPDNARCREFIFEHVSNLSPTRYLKDNQSQGLDYYLTYLYNQQFLPEGSKFAKLLNSSTSPQERPMRSKTILKKTHRQLDLQIDDLAQYFSWMSADISAIMAQRLSRLRLSYYNCIEFVATALNSDPSTSFFEPPSSALVLSNPLNSLPPHQALRLIDYFFHIHPYSIMINKTMLLQAYWTDTADPILLSVIYGTTLFLSPILEGEQLLLWRKENLNNRNPFLDYAHVLLSKASAEATLSRYQAVVLLGLFEITFGYAKKGTSLFALSYMIAEKLGLFNNTLPPGLTPVEKELLLITFWAVFQCTVRGCVELVQIPRVTLGHQLHPYPPMNVRESLSYQLDIQNGNNRAFRHYDYIVETFYIQSVIAKTCCMIIFTLPHEADNETVEQEIQHILNNLYGFIQRKQQQMSKLQAFTLELFHYFFAITLLFLKRTLGSKHFKIQQPPSSLPRLDLSDPENVRCIYQALPNAMAIINKTNDFLNSNSASLYQPGLLPRGLMLTTLDAASIVLMNHYTLEPTPIVRQYIETIDVILSRRDAWKTLDISEVAKLEIQTFLQNHMPQSDSSSIGSPSMDMMSSLIPFDLFDPATLWMNPIDLLQDNTFDITSCLDSSALTTATIDTNWLNGEFDLLNSNFMQ